MLLELNPEQKADRDSFSDFADREIIPFAKQFDEEERISPALIRTLARDGLLSLALPREWGGGGRDMITYGLLHEQIGRGCSSVRSLLTVHGMVGRALAKWGDRRQKEYWLPRLASGEMIAAFGLTEAGAGSEAQRIQAEAKPSGDSFILNGEKKWISFGQIANLFLIFAKCNEKPVALLVERDSPGVSIKPVRGLLGTRASMLADVRMDRCHVPGENVVGKVGFGLSHVASCALDEGRYSVAWGCVGIIQACLDACLDYSHKRAQFGALLKDHQLIRQMITDMITDLSAARLLCYQAGYYKDTRHPDAIVSTLIAKYFASTSATKSANNAVQLHGANGCSGDYPVQRYLRDARVMEVIEGSTQIQQSTISEFYRPRVKALSEVPALG